MTVILVYFTGGVLLGALIAFLWSRGRSSALYARASELDRQRQELLARLDTAQSDLAHKREQLARVEQANQVLTEAREALLNAFKALSVEALRQNSDQFLKQARGALEGMITQSQGDLEHRKTAIESLVKPLQETLKDLQGEIRELEGQRKEAYSNLGKELQQLQRETGNLVTALRRPQARGRWGEITLRRVVEVAGMSSHCDFSEQAYIEGEEARLRPDLVIHLPGNREIVVDSKAPLDAYLEGVEATSEPDRLSALKKHALQVRKHMEQLSDKSYWSQLAASPEFVVLFLPGESFFSAALEQDRALIEDGIEKRVIVATPTTLIALLKAVAYGWRQQQVAENAREISELGKELYERVSRMADYLQEVGKSLGKAVDSYNRSVGSFENRVLVTTRRFKELGATVSEAIPILEPVDQIPRTVGQQSLDPNWEPDQPQDSK